MGHAPPQVPPPAIDRLKLSYARGAITLDVFEERVEYLLRNGISQVSGPVPYEAPPAPSVPAKPR